MFKKFDKVFMSAAGEGDAGGGAPAATEKPDVKENEAGGADDLATLKPEELVKRLKEIEAANKKLAENNKALLDEKIKTKEAADKKIKEEQELAKKKIMESGDAQAMLEITQNELKALKSQLEEIGKKENDRKVNLLNKAKEEAFKEDMKEYDFHDFEDAKLTVDWKLYVPQEDPETGKVSFNPEGRKQAKEAFLKKYAYKIKAKDGDPDRSKAQPSTTEDTKEAWKSVFKS